MRQKIYYPADEEKIPLLIGLLSRSEGARTMVFVNTKAFVERVARSLEKAGYRVGVLSGDVPQKKRESLLKKFQAGQLEILVATDVAARGLHIDGVSHVYNYDLPFDAEDYVHRIGRTARLGAEGDAISFACERYAMSLPDIEAYIDQKIPVGARDAGPADRAAARAARRWCEGEARGGGKHQRHLQEAREQRAADEQRRGGGPQPRRQAGWRAFVARARASAPPRASAANAVRVRRASAKANPRRRPWPHARRRRKPPPQAAAPAAAPIAGPPKANAAAQASPPSRRPPHRRRRRAADAATVARRQAAQAARAASDASPSLLVAHRQGPEGAGHARAALAALTTSVIPANAGTRLRRRWCRASRLAGRTSPASRRSRPRHDRSCASTTSASNTPAGMSRWPT